MHVDTQASSNGSRTHPQQKSCSEGGVVQWTSSELHNNWAARAGVDCFCPCPRPHEHRRGEHSPAHHGHRRSERCTLSRLNSSACAKKQPTLSRSRRSRVPSTLSKVQHWGATLSRAEAQGKAREPFLPLPPLTPTPSSFRAPRDQICSAQYSHCCFALPVLNPQCRRTPSEGARGRHGLLPYR